MKPILALMLAFLPLAPLGAAETVSGPARVIDGRTLVVAGTAYRLFGIEAPDLGQTCGRRGRSLRCGELARLALMDLLAATRVTCAPVARAGRRRAAPGPVPSTCAAGGFDVAANMVHTGWAIADPETAPPAYRRVERRSRTRRRGLWGTSFAPPWEWRRVRGGERAAWKRVKPCLPGRLGRDGASAPLPRVCLQR